MKKLLKTICTVSVILSALVALTGCGETAAKRQALYDYLEQVSGDVTDLEMMQKTANNLNTVNTLSETASYAASLETSCENLIKKAEKRNAALTDPEIKEIDDYYIQSFTEMRNSVRMIKEGALEYDWDKINVAQKQSENATKSFIRYGEMIDDYIKKYDIKTNAEYDRLLSQLKSYK